MDLQGKRAIVLGGTSGIGLETTQQLSDAGAQVIAGSRSEANLANVASIDGASGEQIDVLDRAAMQALFEKHAPFDILVNAATGGERAQGPFLEMDLDGFQGSFRKLWGYVNSVRLGAPHLNKDGAIALVSGFPARKCVPGTIAISTVGNAVEGFARGVAPELSPIRINVVSPGLIDTPMLPFEGEQREMFLKNATANFPIPRAGQSEEVARAIVFTLTNDYMTGSVRDVEGGALLP